MELPTLEIREAPGTRIINPNLICCASKTESTVQVEFINGKTHVFSDEAADRVWRVLSDQALCIHDVEFKQVAT